MRPRERKINKEQTAKSFLPLSMLFDEFVFTLRFCLDFEKRVLRPVLALTVSLFVPALTTSV